MSILGKMILVLALWAAPTAAAQGDAPMMAKPAGDIRDEADADHRACSPDGVAVGGYDVVSYRAEGGPLLGEKGLAAKHAGLTYLFVSAANRDAFTADPDRFLPSYGGWCAVTLALGRLTCPDYTNFQIENDELLLFETTGFTNGRVLWNTDAPGYRDKADDNYTVLFGGE